jgi:hypothetical protein
MPRKKKDDTIDWPDNSHVQLVTPSGWCITGHHDDCQYVFRSGKCGCNCHKGESNE